MNILSRAVVQSCGCVNPKCKNNIAAGIIEIAMKKTGIIL
jgi:hypothetical protein